MHFPLKLYQLVQAGPPDVVAWSDNGKSFLVVNADAFCNKILPKHFRHNKLTSFQRQLNLYGFQRIAKGTEAGRYRHALFERNKPELLSSIKRESRNSLPADEVPSRARMSLTEGQSVDEIVDDSSSSEAFDEMYRPSNVPGARAGTRNSTRTRPAEPAPWREPPAPEDRTAALAMLKISRSLSTENADRTEVPPSFDDEISEGSSCSSSSIEPLDDSQSEEGGAHEGSGGGVSHDDAVAAKLAEQLRQSLSRQSFLEDEVVRLRRQMSGMQSTIETLTRKQARHAGERERLQHGGSSSRSPSPTGSYQSGDDSDGSEKRRWAAKEDYVNGNDDFAPERNMSEPSELVSKRIKVGQMVNGHSLH